MIAITIPIEPYSTVLAIDPGNKESAYALVGSDCNPAEIGKVPNEELQRLLWSGLLGSADRVVIEMVASYGMPVGADVFETCVWIGRFIETARGHCPELVFRREVKLHHCGSVRATDATITQALKDRFAKGASNHGKGTKSNPGWFYGFSKDIWQAYALGVYAVDAGNGSHGLRT